MPQALQQQKAEHEYNQFVRKHRASRARCTTFYDSDPPIEPPTQVLQMEVLEVFLTHNPEYNEFRDHLSRLHGDRERIELSKKKWEDAIASSSE